MENDVFFYSFLNNKPKLCTNIEEEKKYNHNTFLDKKLLTIVFLYFKNIYITTNN